MIEAQGFAELTADGKGATGIQTAGVLASLRFLP
jgi:hypothetical protein